MAAWLVSGWLLATGFTTLTQGPEPIAPAAHTVSTDVARLRELLYQRDRAAEQSQAALLLVQMNSAEAQAAVREGLRRHDRPDVFQSLAAAIRLWRDERYIPPLLHALASDTPTIQQAAMDALAAQEAKSTTRWLLALAEDPSAKLQARITATSVLGRCLHKSAVTALMKLLNCDSQTVRQTAAASLAEVSGLNLGVDLAAWQNWWLPYKDLPEDDWLASRASLLADRSRRLADELQRTETALVRTHQTLYSKIPLTDRAAFLQTLVHSEFPPLRLQAITWITEAVKDAPTAELKNYTALLLILSRDGLEPVQRHAVLALETLDDPQAFDRLLQLLQLGSTPIRAAAARSLGRFGSNKKNITGDFRKRTILALEQSLGDAALPVVANAAESLGLLAATESAPLLVGLLKHPDEMVRQAASRALETVSSPAVLDALMLALEDPSAAVRFNLVGALGRSELRAASPAPQQATLLKRLILVLEQDSDPGVRSRAASIIGEAGGPGELLLLWQKVKAKEDNRVQLKAWSAFVEILARTQSLPLLQQWDQQLAELNENGRRTQLHQELREVWLKSGAGKPLVDAASASLVRALLAERKWQAAIPLAVEQTRASTSEIDRRERMRWLLVAGRQGLDDRKPAEVLRLLKEIEDLLLEAKDLGAEFADLRRRAQEQLGPQSEPTVQPAGLSK